MDSLESNWWNLVLIRSDMKGIYSFDIYLGVSRMDRRTLDWYFRMQTMLEAFSDPHNSIAYVNVMQFRGSQLYPLIIQLLNVDIKVYSTLIILNYSLE
jgi:hypothetical protein